MSFRFEVGQELELHNNLTDMKVYMRSGTVVRILSRKTRMDHTQEVERNRYKIAYEFHTNLEMVVATLEKTLSGKKI